MASQAINLNLDDYQQTQVGADEWLDIVFVEEEMMVEAVLFFRGSCEIFHILVVAVFMKQGSK